MQSKSNRSKLDFSDDVMQQIHDNHITMKPGWVFYIGTAAVIFGIGTFTLLASLLFSLVWYQSIVVGFPQLIQFGTQGWLIYMSRLPWMAVGASFLLTLIGWWLIQHSEYGFHHRKRVVGLGIFTVIFVVSLILHQVNVWHKLLSGDSIKGENQTSTIKQTRVLIGRLVRKNQNTYQLLHSNNQISLIRLDENSQLRPSTYKPMIGDRVIILGEWQDDIFMVDRMQIWLKEIE